MRTVDLVTICKDDSPQDVNNMDDDGSIRIEIMLMMTSEVGDDHDKILMSMNADPW